MGLHHENGRHEDEVKHAGPQVLDEIEPLLRDVRALPGLVEKKRGIFYRKSQAFLHFHEDPAGIFVDVKLGGSDYTRLRVSTAAERKRFLSLTRKAVGT
jgi:hypothetical protein